MFVAGVVITASLANNCWSKIFCRFSGRASLLRRKVWNAWNILATTIYSKTPAGSGKNRNIPVIMIGVILFAVDCCGFAGIPWLDRTWERSRVNPKAPTSVAISQLIAPST